jgi:oligopeptide transport system substrate-binding protein
MRRRPLMILAVLVAVVLAFGLLAVCTKDDEPSGGSAGTAGARRGGTLRLAVSAINSLDPSQARTVEQLLVVDQIFDGLTAYNPTTLEPVPSIAERWEVSADQKQWDFFLRPGATYANGRAITAADVKYSLERIAKKGSNSPASDQLEQVAGYAAYAIQGSAPDLAGITAPADNQVHIALDQPLSALPSILGSPLFGIVAKESVEAVPPAPAFAEAPVGSGPFQYNSRTADTITLVRAPGSHAFVERLNIVQFADVPSAYRAFVAGRADWSRVPPEEVSRARQRFGKDAFHPYVAELFYGFNLKNPKFADVRFRAAIVHAIDRQAIVRAIYASTVLPLDGVVVDGVPGHQADACGNECRHDVEQSKRLMGELTAAGINPGEIQLDYDQDVTQEAVAKAIQAQLKEAGIAAALRPKPLKEYQDFAVSGQQELFRLGWIAAYPSPDAFLAPLFLSGSSSNLTGFALPNVDAALNAARAEPDAKKREVLYQTAEKAIMDQLPVVPIAQFQIHAVTADAVRNLVPTSMGTFDASKVWLAAG